jgi:hypothetical protein
MIPEEDPQDYSDAQRQALAQAVWAEGEAPASRDACACPGADRDRRCLGCERRLCPTCAPRTGGGPCPRCSGPVWKDAEPLSPAGRNPAMGTW